jgi:SAM-dependent methyltransferase
MSIARWSPASRNAPSRTASRGRIAHRRHVRLDLPDESVDLIFCRQTFHHLVDQMGAIAEFRRLLRPGGLLPLRGLQMARYDGERWVPIGKPVAE